MEMNVSGGRIELILSVAGWLSHGSNIEAQLPGLCVVASPREACDCGGLEEGGRCSGPLTIHTVSFPVSKRS